MVFSFGTLFWPVGTVVGSGGDVGWTTGMLMCRGQRMTSCVFLGLPALFLLPVLSVNLQLTILAMLVGHEGLGICLPQHPDIRVPGTGGHAQLLCGC